LPLSECEANGLRAIGSQQATTNTALLLGMHHVNRRIYKGGLVIYKITDAGRQCARAIS